MTAYKIVNHGGNNTTTFNSILRPSTQHPALGLTSSGASSLTVDPDAFVVSYLSLNAFADAVHLDGADAWTVVVNGFISATSGTGFRLLNTPATGKNKVTVGAEGAVLGNRDGSVGLYSLAPADVINSGLIRASAIGIYQDGSGDWTITNNKSGVITTSKDASIWTRGTGTHTIVNTGLIHADTTYAIVADDSDGPSVEIVKNSGTIEGALLLGGGNDKVTNSGTITGGIDLGSGDDTFTGGAKSELVFDGAGSDTVRLGAGDDYYSAFSGNAGTDVIDIVDGGAGRDTYNAYGSGNGVVVNLDAAVHGKDYGLAQDYGAKRAIGDVGLDYLAGFEAIIGTNSGDTVYGDGMANDIRGFGGFDHLWGLGGNDLLAGGTGGDDLTGGAGKDMIWGGDAYGTGDGGLDYFIYRSASDSAATAAGRDVIMDFEK